MKRQARNPSWKVILAVLFRGNFHHSFSTSMKYIFIQLEFKLWANSDLLSNRSLKISAAKYIHSNR